MFKSNKPEGPYSMHKFDKRLYDPGFFIDDDGKKYVTHGKTKIYLTRLKDDGTGVLYPNDEGTLIITAPKGYEYLLKDVTLIKGMAGIIFLIRHWDTMGCR